MVAVAKANKKQYDVILLDLDMPIMNGYEACDKIKKHDAKDITEMFKISKADETA